MTGSSPALPYRRVWNIVSRTVHIGAIGVLFGGHVFGIASELLLPWLGLAILTGAFLVIIEAYPNWRWLFQAWALMVLAKVLLLCLVPWLWKYRVPILIAVIVIGSVGSHMPKRFRHYSLGLS